MKICNKCLKNKEITEYYTKYNKCKECCLNHQKEYRKTTKGKLVNKKYFKSKKGKETTYKFKKTEKYKKIQLKWIKSKKGQISSKNANKRYRIKNKVKLSKYHKEYCNKRYDTDLMFKLIINCRRYSNRIIKNKRINKNNKTINYLGCSLEELKNHIESLFIPGMNWNNHGKWHIDHIIPLSSAKTEDDLYKLLKYSNLQPLWAKDNLIKGNKIK